MLRWTIALVLAAVTTAVVPRVEAAEDEAFLKAAMTVMAFDRFAADCGRRGGLSSDNAAAVAAWQATNGVARIRARMTAREREEGPNGVLAKARSVVEQTVAAMTVEACAGTLMFTRLPDAQFASAAPGVLAGLDGAPVQAVPSAAAATPAASAGLSGAANGPGSPPVVLTPGAQDALLKDIDSFGFHSRPSMGIGGFIGIAVFPVVLFRNGDALLDVSGLSAPGGVEAHRKTNSADWTRWRRDGTTLQIQDKTGWKNLHFQVTYPALPAGFTLEGLYRSLSGAGNVAVGGTDSVAVWNEYIFGRDGRVVRGGGAGAYARGGDVTTAASSVSPNHRGRYRINGLTLTIVYDDGREERRIVVTDPTDPKSAIWLDGEGYVRRSR